MGLAVELTRQLNSTLWAWADDGGISYHTEPDSVLGGTKIVWSWSLQARFLGGFPQKATGHKLQPQRIPQDM